MAAYGYVYMFLQWAGVVMMCMFYVDGTYDATALGGNQLFESELISPCWKVPLVAHYGMVNSSRFSCQPLVMTQRISEIVHLC